VGVASLRALLGLHEIDTTSAPTTVRLRTSLEFRRRGRQLKVVMEAKGHRTTDVDPTLVTVVARAFDWFERLATARAASIAELAEADGFDAAYVSHVLPLAFLSPERVGAILVGQQPPEMTADRLIWKESIPALWV
jgi:site-specific DNA recombinase